VGIRKLVGAAVVVICLGMPLLELFDSWDQTLGDDTEADVVLVALCVGFALSMAATIVVTSIRSLPVNIRSAASRPSIVTLLSSALPTPHATGSPPQTPLRV
jgi:hypothetical protein